MRLFDLPAGRRVTIAATEVGAGADDGATLWLNRRVNFTASATDDFECFGGEWRRRFTNCEPRVLDHSSDVWLSDNAFPDRPSIEFEEEAEELVRR